jgi:hypothetical protein
VSSSELEKGHKNGLRVSSRLSSGVLWLPQSLDIPGTSGYFPSMLSSLFRLNWLCPAYTVHILRPADSPLIPRASRASGESRPLILPTRRMTKGASNAAIDETGH